MDRVRVGLTLRAGGQSLTVAGGDVTRFEVVLESHGHEGEVDFVVDDDQAYGGGEKDAFLATFLGPELMEVELTVAVVHADVAVAGTPTPVAVHGLVRDKTLIEEDAFATRHDAVLARRYRVRFCDPARLLWRQHQPCELYVGKTLRDVLEAQRGEKVDLDYDWDAELGATRAQIFLGLGASEPPTSFHDFVMWLVDSRNGYFGYDHATHRYRLAAQKPAPAAPIQLFRPELARCALHLPEVPRHTAAVLNACSESPAKQLGEQAQAVAGVRQERLVRTPIAADVDARLGRDAAGVKLRGLELELGYDRLPGQPFVPGDLVELAADHGFSPAGLAVTQGPFRAVRVELRGEAGERDGEAEGGDDAADAEHLASDRPYDLRVRARLERKDETFVHLPAYVAPRYPVLVEGRVVSEVEGDQTWQAYPDAVTAQDGYKIEIPLWQVEGKPLQIVAPFQPGSSPGQLYLPAYKQQRVLVALTLDQAAIAGFLDWRPGARLGGDGQGDQLLLGKSLTSSTAITHAYEDAQPVFRMLRTNARDTALVEMKEGSLLIQVKEGD
jgi:hypothetical protein